MELELTNAAKEDIKFFIKSGQINIVKKIEKLFVATKENPFSGIGKPEQLKHEYSGKWSRRIDSQHRMVYDVYENVVRIYSLKGHYW